MRSVVRWKRGFGHGLAAVRMYIYWKGGGRLQACFCREEKEMLRKARNMACAHTVVVVVAHHHLLWLAKLAHLAPEILVEGVEVVLQLARVHLVLRVVGRVLVQVRQQDRLRVGRLDVFAGAAVAVAAGADFVVEGAVDFVLLGAEDGGEVTGLKV